MSFQISDTCANFFKYESIVTHREHQTNRDKIVKNNYLCTAYRMIIMGKRLYIYIIMCGVSVTALTSCQESLEDKTAREAREFTAKKCPAVIDAYRTVVDSMTFDRSTHTVHYYFTLGGTLADNRKQEAYDKLLNVVKNSSDLKRYKDAGYAFAYTYHSSKDSGTVVFDAVFTPDDYR